MWNDPGSPWHAQTGGPLLCAYMISVWGRKETERGWILCGKKKNALLGKRCTKQKKVSDSLYTPPPPPHTPTPPSPFRESGGTGAARRATSCHVTVLGPADGPTLAESGGGGGRPAGELDNEPVGRGHCQLYVCVCVREGREEGVCVLSWSRTFSSKPGPDFSLETCTFERREGRGRRRHSALGCLCYIQFEHFSI